MSGISICNDIEDYKERLKTDKKKIQVLKDIATHGFNRLWEKKEDDETNEIYNFIKNKYNKVKDTLSINYCDNLIEGKQKNIFIQQPSCFREIQTVCYNDKTNKYDEICLDKMYAIIDNSNAKPIYQTNLNTQLAECNINSVLNLLSKDEQTKQSLAIMKLIQEEQNKNKIKTDSCSDIRSDVTEEQYVKSFLDCSNKYIADQSNIIKSECHPGITSQMNFESGINRCIVDSISGDNSKVTQRIVRPNEINNPVSNQRNDGVKEPNITNNTNNPNNPNNPQNNSNQNNNQSNPILIIISIFIGFIIFMVFIYFIIKKK